MTPSMKAFPRPSKLSTESAPWGYWSIRRMLIGPHSQSLERIDRSFSSGKVLRRSRVKDHRARLSPSKDSYIKTRIPWYAHGSCIPSRSRCFDLLEQGLLTLSSGSAASSIAGVGTALFRDEGVWLCFNSSRCFLIAGAASRWSPSQDSERLSIFLGLIRSMTWSNVSSGRGEMKNCWKGDAVMLIYI